MTLQHMDTETITTTSSGATTARSAISTSAATAATTSTSTSTPDIQHITSAQASAMFQQLQSVSITTPISTSTNYPYIDPKKSFAENTHNLINAMSPVTSPKHIQQLLHIQPQQQEQSQIQTQPQLQTQHINEPLSPHSYKEYREFREQRPSTTNPTTTTSTSTSTSPSISIRTPRSIRLRTTGSNITSISPFTQQSLYPSHTYTTRLKRERDWRSERDQSNVVLGMNKKHGKKKDGQSQSHSRPLANEDSSGDISSSYTSPRVAQQQDPSSHSPLHSIRVPEHTPLEPTTSNTTISSMITPLSSSRTVQDLINDHVDLAWKQKKDRIQSQVVKYTNININRKR
jgi:hypothetical protein